MVLHIQGHSATSSYRAQAQLPTDGTAIWISINNEKKWFTGQSDGGKTSVEVPSPQVSQVDNQDEPSQVACSKLGIKEYSEIFMKYNTTTALGERLAIFLKHLSS